MIMCAAPSIKTLAYKVICAHPELSGATKTVGAWIIEHFNLETKRCDPGLTRLSRLAGCTERTVRRALKEFEKAGLIRWQRHKGHNWTNAYTVNWEAICSFGRALEERSSE